DATSLPDSDATPVASYGTYGSYRSYRTDESEVAPEEPLAALQPRPRDFTTSDKSPDGKWTAFVKESNVFVKSADGTETRLSDDGKDGLAYGNLSWSPDSKTLAAFRTEAGDRKEVYRIESSPKDGGRARL